MTQAALVKVFNKTLFLSFAEYTYIKRVIEKH